MDDTLFDLGPTKTHTWPDRPRYLMSYAYVNDKELAYGTAHSVDFIVDSGAFTTAASGKQMDHDAYLGWIADNREHITFALSYDVIGDAYASAVNHGYAEDMVGDLLTLVPTYHLGEPWSAYERLCRMHDLVCIGGAVPFAKQHRHLFTVMKQIHRHAQQTGTRLHGLGMTGNSIIHGFPWNSVDSSGWTSPMRFPSLPLADEAGKLHPMEHGWKLDPEERRLVSVYGGDPEVVSQPGWSLHDKVGKELGLERREWVCLAAARSYMYVEAAKNAHLENPPHPPIRVYLSGQTGGLVDGTVGVICRAHALGNPWKDQQ